MRKTEIPKFRDESSGIKYAMGRHLSMKYSKEKAAERNSKQLWKIVLNNLK